METCQDSLVLGVRDSAPKMCEHAASLRIRICALCRARDKGLRTAPLIRFIGAEDGLLSHTHDGARMYINTEGAAYGIVCGECYRGTM